MVKKCPPGVICFENMTILFIFALIIIFLIFYYKGNLFSSTILKNNYIVEEKNGSSNGLFPRPSYSFSNVANDVLMNPYTAPLRDDRVVQNNDIRGGVPINISTQAVDTNYRQVGILTRINGPETILPLMGRPLYTNRDKWQFYTMSDKNNNIKLPVTFKGKSCTNEYGCDDVYNGDSVYVEGYNDAFKVTTYDNNVMQYIPFL
tara:strand:- start:4905 stop:5516 length:612 start_codon:yes stop_codon:yes gene_type:complete